MIGVRVTQLLYKGVESTVMESLIGGTPYYSLSVNPPLEKFHNLTSIGPNEIYDGLIEGPPEFDFSADESRPSFGPFNGVTLKFKRCK